MPMPTAEAVREHEERFPLNERGADLHEGLSWRHGACWLCRKPMLSSPELAPQIMRLRERDGVVELNLGWVQWVSLETMPWAEGAEWEPVDQRGHPIYNDF